MSSPSRKRHFFCLSITQTGYKKLLKTYFFDNLLGFKHMQTSRDKWNIHPKPAGAPSFVKIIPISINLRIF